MAEETKTDTTEKSNEQNTNRNDNRGNDNRGNDNRDNRSNNRRNTNMRRGGRKNFYRKKECKLCKIDDKEINYKNYDLIRRFITEKGKIVPRRMSGNCAKCQRKIKRAIKQARNAAYIPFTKK